MFARQIITMPSANPYVALDTAPKEALAECDSKDARLRGQNKESADRVPSSPDDTEMPQAEMRGANEDGWVVVGARKRTARVDDSEVLESPDNDVTSSVEGSAAITPAASSVEVKSANRDITPDTEPEEQKEYATPPVESSDRPDMAHESQTKKKPATSAQSIHPSSIDLSA